MGKRKTILLRSNLSLEDCLRRMHEETDVAKRTIFSLSGFKGSKPVLSKFDGNDFTLWKRRYYQNSFAPIFFGALTRESRGTRIEGRFDMARFVKVFMAVWLSLAAFMGIPLFVSTLRGQVVGEAWAGIAVPLGLILWGFLLPKLGRWVARGEERYLCEFLETTLAARSDDIAFWVSARTVENKPL